MTTTRARAALLLTLAVTLGGCDGLDLPERQRFSDQHACLTLDCDDDDPCTVDVCDRKTAQCGHTAAADDTVCKDATVCDKAHRCVAGKCEAAGQQGCDDGDACTKDACAMPGGCNHEALAEGAYCGDSTPCAPQPTCIQGKCTPGKTKDCDDGNPCTTDGCDDSGPGCTAVAVADGETCGDATLCALAPVCSTGTCQAAAARDSDDANPCTTDSCGASDAGDGTGCIHAPVADLTACNGGAQRCWQGACVDAPPQMVPMPAASFWMGCVPGDGGCQANESPRHPVALSAYLLDQFEVTVQDYAACVTAGACTPPDAECSAGLRGNWAKPGREQHPINCVSQSQASAFCAWRLPGGALPTEAQFENALRAGQDGLRYPTGDTLPPPAQSANLPDQTAGASNPGWDVLPHYTDGHAFTAPVGSFTHNAFGLADLWGNVWEWTRDWVDPAGYPTAQVTDPTGPSTGSHKPIRGSGFYWLDANAIALRASYRLTTFAPTFVNDDLGFRCAHDLD